ncbi:MAG TPA: GNAT family N-acetyltransferase, partial [Thermotogota bacterium]|nr:GNAT family N-acetyltransferase [Thermotogota bacterium]
DIPQLAIEKDYRRKGIASALLKKVAENRKQGFKLSLLNINSDYIPFSCFMKKHEIPVIVKQYEMLCDL